MSTWPLFVCWCGVSDDTKDFSSLLLLRQVVNTEAAPVAEWRDERHKPSNKYRPTATVHCTTGSIQGRRKGQNHAKRDKNRGNWAKTEPLNVLFALTCSVLSWLVCPQDPGPDIYLFKSSLAAADKLCLSTKLDKTKSHLNGTKQKIMLRIVTGDCSELLLWDACCQL